MALSCVRGPARKCLAIQRFAAVAVAATVAAAVAAVAATVAAAAGAVAATVAAAAGAAAVAAAAVVAVAVAAAAAAGRMRGLAPHADPQCPREAYHTPDRELEPAGRTQQDSSASRRSGFLGSSLALAALPTENCTCQDSFETATEQQIVQMRRIRRW
eukprot:scaffold2136_cov242-Pinguiococcus_pyrenoidosus.AAC.27